MRSWVQHLTDAPFTNWQMDHLRRHQTAFGCFTQLKKKNLPCSKGDPCSEGRETGASRCLPRPLAPAAAPCERWRGRAEPGAAARTGASASDRPLLFSQHCPNTSLPAPASSTSNYSLSPNYSRIGASNCHVVNALFYCNTQIEPLLHNILSFTLQNK